MTTVLPGPQQTWSKAIAGNARGGIVGDFLHDPFGDQLAFLREAGTHAELGSAGGRCTQPAAINPKERVVGLSESAEGAGGTFIWKDGIISDPGSPGGANARTFALHEPGQVVVWSADASRFTHALLWDRGRNIDLGAVGGDNSRAVAINKRGGVTDSAGAVSCEHHSSRPRLANPPCLTAPLRRPPSPCPRGPRA